MNKKAGIVEAIVVILIIILAVVAFYYGSLLFMNKGFSVDYPYNVENQKIGGWHKLWLKDDHTTVYCFDNEQFLDTINMAKSLNKKVRVDYQEYFFRGFFCTSGNDKIGTVVINSISIEN